MSAPLSFIVVGAGIGEQGRHPVPAEHDPPPPQRAHKCDRFIFTNGATGAPIGFLRMGEEFMRDLAADFLFLQHQDLYDMLRALAVEAGAALRFGARVVLSADIVVAADGFDSALRAAVTEDADAPPDAADAHVVATFQVPMAAIRADPALAALCAPRDWHIWLGAGYIMNTNVLAGEEAFTATIIHDFAGPRTPHDADWAEGRTLADLGIELKNFEPVCVPPIVFCDAPPIVPPCTVLRSGADGPSFLLPTRARPCTLLIAHSAADIFTPRHRPRKVLELATTVASRVFVRRPVPEDFVSASSRAVLVGEAAHPMLPASNHGIALVLEDAHTLGALFAHHRAARGRARPAQLLTAYDDLRREHAAHVHLYDTTQRASMRLSPSPSPATLARDAVLRQTMLSGEWDRMDDSRAFRAVWGTELALWAHDAGERAEGWWGMYGASLGGGYGGGGGAYENGSGEEGAGGRGAEGRRSMEVRVVRGGVQVS
ncbi:hypothetical protein HYPSUDRAFT_201111 [Hypholoma sublateritium FD-334 SS-4]|uniref:FAD-binding domain-containing protein n=1 Tax=Hypholoma sublateritium (strain FD-334 SS-4) TaxID=945553 RepID=A0A0D2PW16_HYPSF|nr:hypothetical protein HYPSUDRAFT_201111 [Hypholoma sublateritium FD-334 SS-4]